MNCGPSLDILQFEQQLRGVLHKYDNSSSLRPFVCQGSPIEAKLLIVGFNAATPLPESMSFWEFWTSGDGFNRDKFDKDYGKHRLSQGKKEVGNTRRAIRWLTDVVEKNDEHKCLETNIHWMPSSRMRDLQQHHRITTGFDWLVPAVCPPAMLLHGVGARRHFKCKCGITLNEGTVHDCDLGWGPCRVVGTRHLSKCSKVCVEAWGHDLVAWLNTIPKME